MCHKGVPLALRKVGHTAHAPNRLISFLGYVLCSTNMTVKPTQKKVNNALSIIERALKQKTVIIREMASLLGILNDLCRGVEYAQNYVKILKMEK